MQGKELKEAISVFLDLSDEERERLVIQLRHQKRIRDEVQKLKSSISKAANRIIDIQKECPHLNVIQEYKSDTGNYCKQDDEYWINNSCPDCGKFWVTPQ